MVDADNSALLRCCCLCHGCIDSATHSAAGLQLRDKCSRIMWTQGHPEPNERKKLTQGYNLPAKYILHTVGPIVRGQVTDLDRAELAPCYRSCLARAAEHELNSVAFCCISTREFHFPNGEAAQIAVETVTEFLQSPTTVHRVIFDVCKQEDLAIYHKFLGWNPSKSTSYNRGIRAPREDSFPQPVAPPARPDHQTLVAELFHDSLELAAAAMEGLEGVIYRRDGMVRLDLPQEKQHLLLQRLGGGGHHGG